LNTLLKRQIYNEYQIADIWKVTIKVKK